MRRAWQKLTFPLRRWPRLSRLALAGGAAPMLAIAAANAYILLSTSGESTGNVADVPHAQVAIVLGAFVKPDGKMSPMLADRARQADALWKAGKVDRILVSGDHHSWAYDEPDTMRKALVADGVPPRVIFEDHAGFDTWASMVRARSIFGVHSSRNRASVCSSPKKMLPGPTAAITSTPSAASISRHRPARSAVLGSSNAWWSANGM